MNQLKNIQAKNPGVKIIVTGNWDGEPIWRRQTAQERLAEEINKSYEQPQA